MNISEFFTQYLQDLVGDKSLIDPETNKLVTVETLKYLAGIDNMTVDEYLEANNWTLDDSMSSRFAFAEGAEILDQLYIEEDNCFLMGVNPLWEYMENISKETGETDATEIFWKAWTMEGDDRISWAYPLAFSILTGDDGYTTEEALTILMFDGYLF